MSAGRRLLTHWRAAVLFAVFCGTAAAFRLSPPNSPFSTSIIGAIPITLAAWFFGWRVAVVTMGLEAIVNAGLIGRGPVATSNEALAIKIIEGLLMSLVGIAVGTAQTARHRLTVALSTDTVTGLANRQSFVHHIEGLLRRGTPGLTVAMIDLTDFSDVNETFGYEIGDEVLRTIAARVRLIAGADGFAAKGERDRFAVAWAQQPWGDDAIARELLSTVATPFVVGGGSLQVRAHVGIARWEITGGEHAGDVVRATTGALERAHREGQDWLAALPAAKAEGRSRLETLSALELGIKNGDLRLEYQPIVNLPSLSLRGFEALVRWQHPTRGLIPPMEFIPLAEQSGLIVPLTEWVLRESIRQTALWSSESLRVPVSVNIGAKCLAPAARLPDIVEGLLREYHVDPSLLVIEVTETDAMGDPSRSIAILRSLKALGLRIEMDDFGTGYSSLSQLRQLPLDGVKIDRSFIRSLMADTSTSAIVRAAIDLTHALGLEAVAEGVEDEAVLKRIGSIGCDSAQGYHIARPMSAAAVPIWVVAQRIPVPAISEAMPANTDDRSRGTVLVVDDEPRVRLATHRMLTANGYRVIDAASASEALQMQATHGDQIDIVLTDMYLSDWRGTELAARLRQRKPGLRVIFMSGDSLADMIVGTDRFLAKPFTKQQLLTGVMEALAA
jgi:diguanylate cyclase (GGDEF)-like protein